MSSKGTQHHDQEPSTEALFASHVRAMVDTFEESGNPFIEDSLDLIALDSKEVMGDKAVGFLRDGQSQYERLSSDRHQFRHHS